LVAAGFALSSVVAAGGSISDSDPVGSPEHPTDWRSRTALKPTNKGSFIM
jgi:hypothetical protein